jgi:galactoside O-acetyltransferase
LGDRVSIGPGTVIITGKFLFKEPGLKMVDGLAEDATKAEYGRVEIQNDVYIGANCTILSDVVIGEGSVIGANSLVNKDVPPWSVMVGSPCKKIGDRPRIE